MRAGVDARTIHPDGSASYEAFSPQRLQYDLRRLMGVVRRAGYGPIVENFRSTQVRGLFVWGGCAYSQAACYWYHVGAVFG